MIKLSARATNVQGDGVSPSLFERFMAPDNVLLPLLAASLASAGDLPNLDADH